jgi:serine/threonine protein kinase
MYGVDARFCPTDGSALTTPNVDDDPLIGQKLDGRYLVLRKIAVGGMGAVYEGVQLSIDRPVAIKITCGSSPWLSFRRM